jgi:PhnB protein
MPKGVPAGYHTVTPYLCVKGAAKAIDFYKKAFGAEEVMRMTGPDGNSVMHAELKIGDSHIMLGDEWPGMYCKSPQSLGGTAINLHIYVEDVDKQFARAIDAGCKPDMPLADMFWGDRYGKVVDPFGHLWGLATQKEQLTPQEIEKRSKEFFASMAKQQTA